MPRLRLTTFAWSSTFANSVVSPAMEFRREGLVMGVGAKLFTLAGPVLTYGIGGSIVVGLAALAMGAGR